MFAQRREEQNVADLAAMAGATAHLNTKGDAATKEAAAIAAANEIALDNRYVADPTNGFTIDVERHEQRLLLDRSRSRSRARLTAITSRPSWATTTWPVSVTATAPVPAGSRMPRSARCRCSSTRTPSRRCSICDEDCRRVRALRLYQLPGTGNEDVPQDATQFNWTIFPTASGDSDATRTRGASATSSMAAARSTTVNLNDDIGPSELRVANTLLFSALEASQTGGVFFPVPVVNDEGEMVGWAYFKLLSTEGGSDKVIRGYFVSPVNAEQLDRQSPTGGYERPRSRPASTASSSPTRTTPPGINPADRPRAPVGQHGDLTTDRGDAVGVDLRWTIPTPSGAWATTVPHGSMTIERPNAGWPGGPPI